MLIPIPAFLFLIFWNPVTKSYVLRFAYLAELSVTPIIVYMMRFFP